MSGAKVYMGPLLGMVAPDLRAVDARCEEVAAAVVAHAQDEHPMFKAMFAGRKPALTIGGIPVYVAKPGELPAGTQMMAISWPSDDGPPSVAAVRGVAAPIDHDPGDEDGTP